MNRLQTRRTVALFVAATLCFSHLAASDDEPLHRRIDQLLLAAHPKFSSLVAKRSSNAEFIRRVYLDLAGKIPTAEQMRVFLDDETASAEKREQLIDRLLASPWYDRRMQYVFDEMLMERRPGTNVPDDLWREYLRQSFLKNKPWNTLVAEILSADGADANSRPAAKFYLDRNFDVDSVTRDIGRVFLGVDLECAQCHDHPAIDDYLQRHYYGISAFLKRSYLFTDRKTKQTQLGEKAEGDVTFTSVFTQESSKTNPRMLDLPEIPDPNGTAKQYIVEPKAGARGVPQYSRRLQLARAMVSANNVDFRKNIVNRLWAVMMGRGLVEPLDVRHARNPPSHPKVLDLLAVEFLKHDYDIHWLLRELAMTEAYQRSSQLAGGANNEAVKHYAVGLLKPLSPEQLAWSVMEATDVTDRAMPALEAALLKSDPKFGRSRKDHPLWREEALHKALKSNVDQFVTRFGAQVGQTTTFSAAADQALFLINGSLVQSWLVPQNDNLTDRLRKLEDSRQIAEELYLSVLIRRPSDDEVAEVAEYLQAAGDKDSAVQELAWALLSSTEFRFNH